ncbi:hypothetical protein B7494_g2136 [Chlorociboria aeruginascens]|nr:hypothetical protein B7494_g2136 [Chlorociboria aeruginascens]
MNKFKSGQKSTDIRAKKISAPIPFVDDEFPIRTPGAGIATPLGNEGFEKQLQLRDSVATAQGNIAREDGTARPELVDTRGVARDIPSAGRPSYEAPTRRADQSTSLRISTVMPRELEERTHQRKKSTLKSVIGRLFGKKRPSMSSIPSGPQPTVTRAGHHLSDPTALNRSPQGTPLSQQRSTSLPINELNRGLHSHSIANDDFHVQGSVLDSNRSSTPVDEYRSRRVTTPSRLYTPNKTPGATDFRTGLSPRPSSSHVRGSKALSSERPQGIIGMAVTSGSHPNRRSRSLGHLRDAPTGIASVPRRRSDEIRYWRESYDPGLISPMSSNKAEAEEPILVDEQNIPEAVQGYPQPFNFGPLSEMAGMKITQAASLETRVSTLEARMSHMEKVISQIHQRTGYDSVIIQDAPKRILRRERSPTTDISDVSLPRQPPNQRLHGNQKRSSSYGSSRPTTNNSYQPSFVDSLPPHPTFADDQTTLNTLQESGRPLSTSTTIRAIPLSSPTIPKDGHLTMDHYSTLTNMIHAEQSARQDLEITVRSLQQQIQILRSSASAPHISIHNRQLAHEAGDAGEFSSFEQDDSDDEVRYETEVFRTPSEEKEDDIFGEIPNGGKGAPRTLSLSQITMKVPSNTQKKPGRNIPHVDVGQSSFDDHRPSESRHRKLFVRIRDNEDDVTLLAPKSGSQVSQYFEARENS